MKLPNTVGHYHLVKSLKKQTSPEKLLIGKYRMNGKLYVIKLWRQGMPALYHRELLREFSTSKILHDILITHAPKGDVHIQTPLPVQLLQKKSYTALVFRYAPGKNLLRHHSRVRARVLARVIKKFGQISQLHIRGISPALQRHHWWTYAFSLPYVAAKAYLRNNVPFKHVVASTWTCVLHLHSIISRPTVMAHCDLLPENILVNGRKIVILDTSHLALTPRGYDLTYLAIHESLHGLSSKIISMLNAKPCPFFTAYICLKNSDHYNPIKKTNYYASTLAATYGT